MKLHGRVLVMTLITLMTSCSDGRSANGEEHSSHVSNSIKSDIIIEKAAMTVSIGELCNQIRFQTGFTKGYGVSKWQNTILINEPSISILSAAKQRRDEVRENLIRKLDDYTVVKDCVHFGRSSRSPYTVSDVACYLLVQLHTYKSIEAVIQEMQRRKDKVTQSWGSIAWAIDYYEVIK